MLHARFRSLLPGILASACLWSALPSGAQSFRSVFKSGYDGWIPDFADYAAADSAKRELRYEIGEIPSISPAMTALRMTGVPAYPRAPDSTDDLFPFIRKRFTGLAPNTEYGITFKAEFATALGQFNQDTLWIKAAATVIEPRKTASSDGTYRMNIAKGLPRRPGADMDTLGSIGYTGGGHRFPEVLTLGNPNHPIRSRTDGTGAVWISLGAEYIPSAGTDGTEFNIGTLQVDFTPLATSLRPHAKSGTVSGRRVFDSRHRARNLLGVHMP